MAHGVGNPISWLGQSAKCCEINRSMGSNDDFSTNEYSFKCVTVTPVINYNMKLATWIKKMIEMLLSYEVRFFFNLKVYKYIHTHTTSYCCKSRHSNSY